MNEEEICQICEERKVTDECVSCHKRICADCCISGVGVCVECSKPQEEDLIPMLIGCGAIQYGTFTLASGKESSYYVDMKKAITEIPILKKVAEIMAPYIGRSDKIGCVELGAVPIAVALSLHTERPYIILRKEQKEHGTQKAFEGEVMTGESVIFVEDVTTTGGSLVRAINLIRDSGGVIEKALVIVDREEGAAENLGNIGVELIPLVRASEIKQ